MPHPNTELTVQEMKTIIHALRMSTLSFVEENAINEIQSMIKALPLPEEIDRISVHTPLSIKKLQKDIGNIMRLIELYGKRDLEFKTRYISRTGLPPRYRVLDWRKKQMRPEVKASIKEMVKISSDIDNKGYGEISGHINKFASKIIQNQFDDAEYEKISSSLKNAGLEKEAQFWAGVKGFMGGAGQKAGDVLKGIWQSGVAGSLSSKYDVIYKQIVDFKASVDALAAKAVDPNIRQQMQELSKNIEIGATQINQGVQKAKSREQKVERKKPHLDNKQHNRKTPAGFQMTPDIEKQLLSMGWQKPVAAQTPAGV